MVEVEAAEKEARLEAEAEAEAAAASQPSAPGKRRRAVPLADQQYTKLRYTPPSEGERQGVWRGMTAGGDVHEVYRNGFNANYQQLCKDKPNEWVTSCPPSDPSDPRVIGYAADVR